jgi:hypothetical protein
MKKYLNKEKLSIGTLVGKVILWCMQLIYIKSCLLHKLRTNTPVCKEQVNCRKSEIRKQESPTALEGVDWPNKKILIYMTRSK